MNYLARLAKTENPFIKGGLWGAVGLFTLAVTYVMARGEAATGILAIGGVVGVAICILTLAFPIIGFYVSFISGFFIFDVIRFLNVDLPLVSGIDMMVYLTFVGVIVQKIRNKETFWMNCRNPIVYMYVVIIAYYLIEFFNPNSISREIYFLLFRRFATLLLFFYCSIQLFKDFDRIKTFVKIVLVLTAICAAYGVYQKWFGLPHYVSRYYSSRGSLGLGMLDNGESRIGSFLPDCTAFGILMAGALGMGLVFLLNAKLTRPKKILMSLAVIAMAMSMSYSGTRTATFMVVVEVCLYILMTSTQRKTIVFAISFAALFAVLIFGPSYGNSTINRLKSTFESEDESLKVRDVNRAYIQPYIYEHPIGGGVGTTGVVYYEYNIGHPLAGFPTDSGLLAMVLEFGWVGLLIQCITYFVSIQQGIRGYFRSRRPEFKLYYLSAVLCLFGYVAAQYAQIAIGQIPGGFLFYCLTAIIIRLRQIEAQPKSLHS
jgi:putative inorganic carbon (hco3(-)) transporter